MSAWDSSVPIPVSDDGDYGWDDDLDDDGAGSGSGRAGEGGLAQGWLAGANATRCSCHDHHERSCGSYEGPPSWGGRLRRRLFGGAR